MMNFSTLNKLGVKPYDRLACKEMGKFDLNLKMKDYFEFWSWIWRPDYPHPFPLVSCQIGLGLPICIKDHIWLDQPGWGRSWLQIPTRLRPHCPLPCPALPSLSNGGQSQSQIGRPLPNVGLPHSHKGLPQKYQSLRLRWGGFWLVKLFWSLLIVRKQKVKYENVCCYKRMVGVCVCV